jgi:tetratricopeptide (TPR) repeat protein
MATECALPAQSPVIQRLLFITMAVAMLLLSVRSLQAQASERPLLDVRSYEIDASIDPVSRTLQSTTTVHFIARETISEAIFELHNDLAISEITDAAGNVLVASRFEPDFTVRVRLFEPVAQDQPSQLTFTYSGQLLGYQNSPVEGVDVANLNEEGGWLLYPARWFPVNGIEADQFKSNIKIELPTGYSAVGSAFGLRSDTANGTRFAFDFTQDSFPGSVAIVTSEPISVSTDNGAMRVYRRQISEDLARDYGQAAGEMVGFFRDIFGPPYSGSLIIVETGQYTPDGYAAPGIIFMSPYGLRTSLNRRLLARQVAHQWWRSMVTPGNRSHLWLDYGFAWYAALLETEAVEGAEAFDAAIQQTRVEALTFSDIPIIQSGRLPMFSPELQSLAGAKGAMVLHMLRWVMGDDPFVAMMRELVEKFTWKSATTTDVEEIASRLSNRDMQPFFLQWIEATATPEFKQEYTIYRLGGGQGFQVLGKVQQDMDTFRMPVELLIETEGEPEYRTVEVSGTSSDYTVAAFGKPRRVILDPNHIILRFDDDIRVQVAIRKGEQLVELGYSTEALQQYQDALDISRYSSLAHYRIAEVFFMQNNYQSAANEFREALNGDQEPEWTVVWAHINLGKIFDMTGQRERAVNEYQLAIRTRDNTRNAQDESRKLLENPYRRPRRDETVF